MKCKNCDAPVEKRREAWSHTGPTVCREPVPGYRAVIVEGPAAEDWRETVIDGQLETLQSLVGGFIERLPIPDDKATVWLNESGKLDRLPVSAMWTDSDGTVLDGLRGPLVVLGPADDEGGTTSLTDEALAFVKTVVRPACLAPSARVIAWEDAE